jgi:tRNA 2-selenouridine synthase
MRLQYITSEYGRFKKENLINATLRIQKRLGNLNAKNAINYFIEHDNAAAFGILLTYYDKYYSHALHQRENLNELLSIIPCDTTDEKTNAIHILNAVAGAERTA